MKQVKSPEERENCPLTIHHTESNFLNNMDILIEIEYISFYKVKTDNLVILYKSVS